MIDRLRKPLFTVAAFMLTCTVLRGQQLRDLTTPTPLRAGSTLVVGFLGGYERWNDEHRSVRQLIVRLRNRPGVSAESFSNHRRSLALAFIKRELDANGNGRLDPDEKSHARLVLVGQSWGGAAVVATARDLEKIGVPVLLTVQVDSVGTHDRIVPRNVRAAVNFYQHDPLTIQGRSEIVAADPARTSILGNFERSYTSSSVDESNASWPRKTFGGGHAKMELDPAVWHKVEQYISDAIARR